MTHSIIAPDSLIGLALSDAEDAHVAASFDDDGYQDTLEADHQLEIFWHLERLVSEHADVMAVYAEEATRWS